MTGRQNEKGLVGAPPDVFMFLSSANALGGKPERA
jgi:hypothetical protein